jgi:hypothetical protein
VQNISTNLGVTPAYVLDGMSYENIIMYSKAAPSYSDDDWDYDKDANEQDTTGAIIGEEENII